MQNGFILIWVLFAMLLVLPLTFLALELNAAGYSFASDWEKDVQSLYCAEAGFVHATEWLKAKNPPPHFEADFAEGSYEVEIVPIDKKTYLIRSTGQKAGKRSTILVEIEDNNFKVRRWEEE